MSRSAEPPRTRGRSPWALAYLAAVLVLALVTLFLAGAAPASAAPDGGLESRFVALINQERAAAGVGQLRVADDLVAVGRQHARRMADGDHLHHNPNLGGEVSGWDRVGENVGRGPDLERIHAAFMASDGHRTNLLDPTWTEVGVGVEVVDGGLWVTELFRLPTAAASAPEDAAPSDAPQGEAAPVEPEAPVAHDVVDVPLPADRITLVLARLDASDGHGAIDVAALR